MIYERSHKGTQPALVWSVGGSPAAGLAALSSSTRTLSIWMMKRYCNIIDAFVLFQGIDLWYQSIAQRLSVLFCRKQCSRTLKCNLCYAHRLRKTTKHEGMARSPVAPNSPNIHLAANGQSSECHCLRAPKLLH